MLTLLGRATGSMCDGVSRRGFLRVGSLGLAGLTLPDVLQARALNQAKNDTAVILWWMGGGPSQNDTYDPKADAPAEVRGPFSSIATAAPGLRFTDQLPLQAKIADKLALLRSVTHYENNHTDAAHLVQTGYHERDVQFRGQFHPAQGSIAAKLRGANRPGLPSYVCLPSAYSPLLGFVQRAAYLGKEFDPIDGGGEPGYRGIVKGPDFTPHADLTVSRIEDRKELLRRMDSAVKRAEPSLDGMDSAYRKAFELVSSRAAMDAFDLTREPVRLLEKYGDNPWGKAALQARRLVEAGVTFVTVNHYEADIDWWDDHYTIEKNLKKRLPPYDRALAALIADLHDRGLASRVLLVAMGEFGRSPKVDSAAGRGHWAKSMSVLLSGGGVKGGCIVGATTKDGGEPAGQAHSPGDVLATIYHVLGIDHTSVLPDQQKRPVRLVDRGEPIRELFA
jgi:uncharacterized protein (DUF1501 family)